MPRTTRLPILVSSRGLTEPTDTNTTKWRNIYSCELGAFRRSSEKTVASRENYGGTFCRVCDSKTAYGQT